MEREIQNIFHFSFTSSQISNCGRLCAQFISFSIQQGFYFQKYISFPPSICLSYFLTAALLFSRSYCTLKLPLTSYLPPSFPLLSAAFYLPTFMSGFSFSRGGGGCCFGLFQLLQILSLSLFSWSAPHSQTRKRKKKCSQPHSQDEERE